MPDFHLIATFAIIAATIIAYASERWPMETVSLVSLAAVLILFGVIPYSGPDGTPACNQNGFWPGFPTRRSPR